MFAGMGLELLPVTQWHVRLTTGWMALILFLGPIVLLLFAWRGSRKAALALSASSVLMVALSFTGIMSALLAIAIDYPSTSRLVSDHVRLSERGSIALLTGDAEKAVVAFKSLHSLRTDPG